MIRALVLAAAVLGACGQAGYAPPATLVPPAQSTPQPTPEPYEINRGGLEALITQSTNQNIRKTNAVGTADKTICVQEGIDGLHFVCNIVILGNRYTTGITVKATCDTTGNCVWRPE